MRSVVLSQPAPATTTGNTTTTVPTHNTTSMLASAKPGRMRIKNAQVGTLANWPNSGSSTTTPAPKHSRVDTWLAEHLDRELTRQIGKAAHSDPVSYMVEGCLIEHGWSERDALAIDQFTAYKRASWQMLVSWFDVPGGWTVQELAESVERQMGRGHVVTAKYNEADRTVTVRATRTVYDR